MDNFVLIIGAMKCGTTSLFNYLADHPQIAACSQKEPRFFANEAAWSKGWNWYQDLWQWDPSRHKIAMEASTSYSKTPIFAGVADRIAAAPARFRFIYLMRDPIERLQSHLTHAKSTNWGREEKELIAISSYAMQLDEYATRFPRQDIKLVLFEDLVAHPERVVRDICRFLEVDTTYLSPQIHTQFNANRFRPTHPALIRLGRAPGGRRILSMMPPAAKTFLRYLLGGNRAGNTRLPAEDRARLLAALAPDIQRLRADYGVDLSRWNLSVVDRD